eukprot:scaffold13318_cov257-Ochromonas_danica.AAC.3
MKSLNSPDVHISGFARNHFSTQQDVLGTSSVTLTLDQWTVCPSYTGGSNTDSASANVYVCSFTLCPQEEITVSLCQATVCNGDTFIRIKDSSGKQYIAIDDGGCGACSVLTNYDSSILTCITMELWQGCYASKSCGGESAIYMSVDTPSPTIMPTIAPTQSPTISPTHCPSSTPSTKPSSQPTSHPSSHPSSQPTVEPSSRPTSIPTNPSSQPSSQPSVHPSSQPSTQPSSEPSTSTIGETFFTTFQPTLGPSF